MASSTSLANTPPATPSTRYVCVHGHFYQPPRENPWLETVEVQESAAPYHDWNERITSECYAPNGASRITNIQNQIIRIVNNYGRMSFNFGPTLLSWLRDKAPRAYRTILDADRASAERYSGHGSALAQVYNHIIMPLASRRDALTQIRWGIADFEFRYRRKPEGMWLAETAVNREVLDLMAQEGIRFTVLAPNQCARVRRITEGTAGTPGNEIPWTGTPNDSVDTTHPYRVPLDDGRSIAVFFYDGPASRGIAFEGLLNSGEEFGRRLLRRFDGHSGAEPLLSHVATDGESYGHHHKHGEMALSYAFHWIEENGLARLTNYGEFLSYFPPKWEAEVAENTSWSCAHGVERWRSNCGCNGGKPGWNQEWRRPLREALDLLRDQTEPMAERFAKPFLKDLWAARDAYIDVILDRSPAKVARFLAEHATHELSPQERVSTFELLELERHTQLMYTSCGWFFDEISGIETVQIIAYAGRVLQLADKLFGEPGKALEAEFLDKLSEARSNVPEIGTGAEVYRRYVAGMSVGLEEVGAHYAISSVFRTYPEDGVLFCYDVHRDGQEVFASGRGRVAIGRASIQSRTTEEAQQFSYAVLHLGDQNLSAAVKPINLRSARFRTQTSSQTDARNGLQIAAGTSPESSAQIKTDLQTEAEMEIQTDAEFAALLAGVEQAIRHANLPEVIRLIDRSFGGTAYSLTSLFSDEQHRILRTILDRTVSEIEDSLRKIYEDHASLLHYLTESGVAAPAGLALAANFAVNARLRQVIESDIFNPDEIEVLLSRARTDQVTLDTSLLSYAAAQRMKTAMIRLEASTSTGSSNAVPLSTALNIAETIRSLPLEVNLWQSQNIWNDLLQRSRGDYWTSEWKEGFQKLGLALNICVDQLVVEQGVTIF